MGARRLPEGGRRKEVVKRFVKSVGKGLLKVMSKMGISTYQSYCGAQIFDALGLRSDFVSEVLLRHTHDDRGRRPCRSGRGNGARAPYAFGDSPVYRTTLDVGGEYAFRLRGEDHVWRPETVSNLQHAVRGNAPTSTGNMPAPSTSRRTASRRSAALFRIKPAGKPIPLEQVEPASAIVRRFATGAMSFGSISREAHEITRDRHELDRRQVEHRRGRRGVRALQAAAGRRSKRSAIKQVASGRFGVTTEYLVNSDMMQIKMAQGAKPGEGGQLPGHKVDAVIAKVRHSTQGVGLISPPPHHDIYSIEDLAQLIYDLKNVNPAADVSVKLVSEVGVGTVAAGVAKARADHITISGFEGGTGASP